MTSETDAIEELRDIAASARRGLVRWANLHPNAFAQTGHPLMSVTFNLAVDSLLLLAIRKKLTS